MVSLKTIAEAIPSSSREWATALALWAGGLAGWVVHPSIWLCFGPLRWLAFLSVTAASESSWVRDASGDGGKSFGVLQFSLAHTPRETSQSPFRSGYAAAGFVSAAVLQSPWWWTLALPVAGFGVGRYLWTHGVSAASGRAAWLGDRTGTTWWSEPTGATKALLLAGVVLYRGATLIPLVVLFVLLGRKKKGRKRR